MKRFCIAMAMLALAGCAAHLGMGAGTTGNPAYGAGAPSGNGGAYSSGTGNGGTVATNGSGASSTGSSATPASNDLPGVDGMPPGQWALFEQEAWLRLRQDLSAKVVETREQCGGSQIVSGYAFESFRGQTSPSNSPWGIGSYAAGACPDSVHALRDMCVQSPLQAQAIRSQVRRVECGWGEPNVTYRDGVVYVTLDNSLGTSWYSTKVTEVMMANLH